MSPDGQALLWGRKLPRQDEDDDEEERHCSVVLTDLQDMEHHMLGEMDGISATFGPDGQSVLVAATDGRRSVLRELRRDGTEVRTLLSSRRRLVPSWFASGEIAVWTGWTVKGKRRKSQRIAWGTDTLRWLDLPRGRYAFAGRLDGDLLLKTRLDRDRQGVFQIDPADARRKNWVELLADTETEVIQQARLRGDKWLVATRADGVVALIERPFAGGDDTEVLPEKYSWVSSRRTQESSALIRSGSPQGQQAWLLSEDGVLAELDGLRIKADVAFLSILAPSADGTQVPVSVIVPRELELDGNAPVWLRAYGGFGSGTRAFMGPDEDLWIRMGGIVATVHARGGDERGEAWHEGAKQANFGLTFDDVIGAGEWFVNEGYSRPGRLVISGGSNGGLTAAACVARRPDLFGAAVSWSGVLDLIRGPEMGNWWPAEYGRPGNPEHRVALLADSPLHQEPEGLPPVLLISGVEDPTVTPSHSYKLATAWSELGGGPVLLRILPWPSHLHNLGGKRQEAVREEIDEDVEKRVSGETLAFLIRALDLDLPELPEDAKQTE